MDKTDSDGWEAAFFASNPFLTNLAAFVRGKGRKNNEEEGALLEFEVVNNKPATLTSLSPEVLARLRLFPRHNGSEQPESGSSDDTAVVGEDGAIDWSRVSISSSTEEEDGAEGLAEGARLAASCHAGLLQRSAEISSAAAAADGGGGGRQQCARGALPWVFERIVQGSDEEAYLALCVCLAVTEKALYGIYREGSDRDTGNTVAGDEGGEAAATAGGAAGGDDALLGGGGGGGGGTVAGRAMILRDLIATPQVKEALPEHMVTVLRLLLLPLGFNIRNLVWHGFLAPHELPRELASLVLMVTASIPDASAAPDRDGVLSIISQLPKVTNLRPPATDTSPPAATAVPDAATKGGCCSDAKDPSLPTRSARGAPSADQRLGAEGDLPQPPPPPLIAQQETRCAGWALDSFDGRLACPPVLERAVESLLSEEHRAELSALIRRTAFVFPGREEMVLLALGALRKGQHVLFLVAMLPVLEHGLRCLFSCANDSPGHLFAHLKKYYSTLDGFGQRARHQLLLDQEMSGSPHRPNVLLASLGPGMSACLLDLFMMDAGPCVRGKVAHAEVDMSTVFTPLSPSSFDTTDFTGSESSDSNKGRREIIPTSPGVIDLTAAAFFVLCSRYDPTATRLASTGNGGGGGGSSSSSSSSSAVESSKFDDALVRCEALCAGWTSRFHPHELLEMDLQASWAEFDRLALALQSRAVSIERVPGREDLAVMSVCISRDCDDNIHVETNGVGTGQGKTAQAPCGEDGGRVARTSESERGDGGYYGQRGKKDESPLGSCAGLVLTVTDAAHRLLPPPAATALREGPPSSPATKYGGEGKKKMKRGVSATSGMFPTVLRVNTALRELNIALACRFKRLGCHGANGNNGGPIGDSARARPVTPPSGGNCELSSGLHPSSARVSAFEVFKHSERCPAEASCCLECRCLDDSASSPRGDETRADADERQPKEQQQRQMIVDSDGCCSIASPVTDQTAATTPPAVPLTRAKRNLREPNARISPPTNVVAAALLPQIGCLGGICRVCADIAGSLLHRIGELEALLASGTARSGQRRQYAVTLSVAPTLLRFLAATMSAVEAFVLEWRVRYHDGIDAIAAQTPPDAAPGLTFLRRLAAVNGALGLCVLPGVGGAAVAAAAAAGEQPNNTSSRGDVVTKEEGGTKVSGSGIFSSSSSGGGRSNSGGGDGAGRKGYVQALAELATFLETKTARRGFSGC